MYFNAILALPLVLMACVQPVPLPVPDPAFACGADELQYLVGKPGVLLDGMRFSQDVRVIQPGMAVTMDFKPDRLNIWLDERDVIVRVVCG
ncbi:MAG: hypothetical protein C0524_18205 [Rhodobacter sp.]|nr:hypothetical protein [Rhodobacter sp.]